ncbi:MAG: response regulator [Acidobacteriota bacterium]|nr:response regulator [Acidobacteriota bacterium]
MTTEPTQPQGETGQVPVNGQGQSQGHRRRRRRRKNKSSQQGAPQAQQGQAQHGQGPQPQGQNFAPRGQGQGHSRKKKKFFKQGGSSQPEPGNRIDQPSKRKDKQKGPRTFVGPMDHSYRAANGNVADGPPSTIPVNGNGHGGYYADPYNNGPVAPVREDAPTRIYCFIEDLFFQAKIHETSRKLGIKVEFVKGDKEGVAKVLDKTVEAKPALIVFDLNNANAKPMTLIPKFKTKFKKSVSIVGFLNHLQGDLKVKAIEAGCDTVMPRSAFSQTLPNLLRRYGMEEEEEYYPQPV